jgi:hypothetical protein
MLSHLRAVLVVTGTLVLAGTVHTISTAAANTATVIALVPASTPEDAQSSQVRAITVASARAIGY